MLRASFFSAHRKRTVRYLIAYPPNVAAGTPLPVCLFLHGHGGDESDLEEIGYHRMLAARSPRACRRSCWPRSTAATGTGTPGPTATTRSACCSTTSRWYWRQHGLPVTKLAVLGISMGGFGALLAAPRRRPGSSPSPRHAPAFWLSFDEAQDANPGAFDSAEDWLTWGTCARGPSTLAGHAVRIDCGAADPFEPTFALCASSCPTSPWSTSLQGCHDGAFWRSVAPAQLS